MANLAFSFRIFCYRILDRLCNRIFNIMKKLLKKIFFYFLLFTGIILSTSFLGDNFMGISDEEGYMLTIGVCCLIAFFLEYFIPKIRKKSR